MNAITGHGQWDQAQERTFLSFDGAKLFYRQWGVTKCRRALVILHRGHEHSGRLGHLAPELALDGWSVYVLDARGHGRSATPSATSVAELTRDLDCFVRHLSDVDGIDETEIVVLAHSVGAVVATAWVHDYAPRIRGLSLAAPAFDVDLRVPFARSALSLARRFGAVPIVRSRVTPDELTDDPERQRTYKSDPLINLDISTDLLLDLKATSDRIVKDAQAITVPTQLLIAGADRVVRPGAADRFFDTLGAQRRERHFFPELRHDLLGERERGPVTAAIRGFATHCWDTSLVPPDLTGADRSGYTHNEAEGLRRPLGVLSARGIYWRGMRTCTRLGAAVSRGLAIGVETGFDSGTMLDYVYRNQPQGVGRIGRLTDRHYLDAIGWRGIRQRKRHLEELIGTAQARLRRDGVPVHVVDIAAGHGRYVLDALGKNEQPDTILLRDYCARNVASGTKLIAERALQDVATFEQGDAFDRASIAALTPVPTLAIVSGLYELFPENAPVRDSLAGLAEAMPDCGYLVYTGQPWHPQLEQIARTLSSHRGGQDWVMRRRTQQEMDQLVRAAGFAKIEQRIDRWGIFTVSIAQRTR